MKTIHLKVNISSYFLEGIKLNYTASSEMKILELHDVIFKDWGQKTLASLQLWSQNMDEGPARYYGQ